VPATPSLQLLLGGSPADTAALQDPRHCATGPRGLAFRGGLCAVLAPEGCAGRRRCNMWRRRVGPTGAPSRFSRSSSASAMERSPRSPVLNGELVPARVGLRETGLGWVRGELVPGRVGGRWPRPAFQPVETRGPASRLPTERLVGRRLSTANSCRHEFGAADRQTGQPSPGQWRSAQINQC